MIRWITVFAVLLSLAVAGVAVAQEEAHYEGYFINSAHPPTNPNPGVIGLEGRGLVTALAFPGSPLTSDFVHFEYTWVLTGALPAASSTVGTTTYTTYNVSLMPATITIYEDKLQDARPTFYLCPADITPSPPGDGRYSNGPIYLRGHFVTLSTQYDSGTLTGTFTGQLNWDSGSHLFELPIGRRGGFTFGGTTTFDFACIPLASGYDQAMTGRIFQLTTAARTASWGVLRTMYH